MTEKELLQAILHKLELTDAKVTSTQDQLLHFQKDMMAFKADMLEFKEDMTSFKADMLEFKEDMTSFKADMLEFKEDMTSFKADMLEFKEDMTSFKASTLAFQAEAAVRFQSIEDTAQINKELLIAEIRGHKQEMNDRFQELNRNIAHDKRSNRRLLKGIESDLNDTMERVERLEQCIAL
ncbi:hypothetical protein [Paenibacillus sp. YN15]|uniref:hypothetical protein n=1 Tax=Paenibacillus sp. YN15 TaxID=1742774 RepID=UPI000DCB5D72|nr:hypothetical protein [Paenibacillus sp. YN15]RAU99869.1 hypothetical protein DQG13_15340 [Paenibacillus sp. YN15]